MRSFVASVLLHLALVLVAVFGLPWFQSQRPEPAGSLPVQVISEAELAALTAATSAPSPTFVERPVETRTPPPAEPAPPPPPQQATTPPRPEPTPIAPPPPPQVAALPESRDPEPLPEPAPAPEPPAPEPPPEPEPEPEPEPTPAPTPPPPVEARRPDKKPTPPKPPEAEQPRPSETRTAEPTPPAPAPAPTPAPTPSPVADLLKRLQESQQQQQASAQHQAPTPTTESRTPQRLTPGEEDLVRQKLKACWNVDVNAADIPAVPVRVVMNADGTVKSAELMASRPGAAFEAAAQKALRAVRNPNCQPWPLPADKWPQWQVIQFNFEPADVF